MPHDDPSAPWHDPTTLQQMLREAGSRVPLSTEQMHLLLELARTACGAKVLRVLNLGCAEGVVPAAFLDEFSGAQVWIIDASEALLRIARRQLHPRIGAEFLVADLRSSGWMRAIQPEADFDVIVAADCLQELSVARKREVYRECFSLLRPGGVFFNVESVSSPTRWTKSRTEDFTIDAIFGDAIKAAPHKARADVAREYYAEAGADTELPAPLEVQCDWLREDGFESVECYLKVEERAVFGGQRPAAEKLEQ